MAIIAINNATRPTVTQNIFRSDNYCFANKKSLAHANDFNLKFKTGVLQRPKLLLRNSNIKNFPQAI